MGIRLRPPEKAQRVRDCPALARLRHDPVTAFPILCKALVLMCCSGRLRGISSLGFLCRLNSEVDVEAVLKV
jgi:hypothetical protein